MPRKKIPPVMLSEAQEKFIRDNFKKINDINVLTKKTFNDETLDGRNREGIAIAKYIKSLGGEYRTKKIESTKLILSDDQKQLLMSEHIGPEMTAIEIARIAFKDRNIKPLSKEHITVSDFLKEFRPEIINNNEVTTDKYMPPHALSRAIKKVNDYLHKNYEEMTLPTRIKKYCEKLLDYLHSPRFISIINQYSLVTDRELFEAEYVRAVWDKPDLTIDELNNYITVCSNYVRLRHIQNRIDNLNKLLSLEHDDTQVSIKLNELLKATSGELDSCEKRIETMTKNLNGTRANRLKDHQKDNGSILALVEAFQMEEERRKLIDLVEMENKLVEEEVEKFEDLEGYKVRILGIDKEEFL